MSKTFGMTITWENSDSVAVAYVEPGGEWKSLINMRENGSIEETWASFEGVVKAFVAKQLAQIGKEMKE